MASRILGMGDVLSLIEEAHKTIDVAEAQKLAKKVKSGKGFDLDDFKAQIAQMRKMGGIAGMLDKLPASSRGRAGYDDEREEDRAHRRDHQFDDARGARKAGDPQGVAQAPRSLPAPACRSRR
jgi:signal recognition particle subunit SRP54